MAPIATLFAVPESGEVVVRAEGAERDVTCLFDERLPATRRRRRGRAVVLEAFDAVPIARWVDRHSIFSWGDGVERMLANRRLVLDQHPSLYARVAELKQRGVELARRLLADQAPKLEALDDHQWVNVAAMTLPGTYGMCLFDEQGAGKTVTVIHANDLLADSREIRTTIVVAPKSMLSEWERDTKRFMGDLYGVELLVGDRRRRRGVLGRGPEIVLASYETVVSMEAEVRSYCRNFDGRALLVVDESFAVKNRDARRTRALRRLREEFDRAVVLCGTPAPNAPHDIIAQFDLVDFGWTFRDTPVPEDRDAAVPVVRDAMERRGIYTRHLKEDVLPELPAKTFHRLEVALAPEQGAAYAAALNDLILDLRSTTDQDFARQITHYLARRSVLLRICSDPAGVIPGYNELPGKFGVLDELLDDWITQRDEKVVLWSFYTNTVSALVERYARFNPVRLDGTVASIADRRDAVRRFQEDDETYLFVGNAGAGGAGLTLHRARLAIYESLSAQAAHFMQSVDRIHRRGQEREAEYVVMLARGSIEITEFDRVLAKEARGRDLLGDRGTPTHTRQSMLDDLLRSAAELEMRSS